MKEIGRVKIAMPKKDKTKYVGTCPCCGRVYQFDKSEMTYIKPEPETYIGEFNKVMQRRDDPYYVVYCPKDNTAIYLGDGKELAGHIKNKKKREQEVDKYYPDYSQY